MCVAPWLMPTMQQGNQLERCSMHMGSGQGKGRSHRIMTRLEQRRKFSPERPPPWVFRLEVDGEAKASPHTGGVGAQGRRGQVV